METTTKAIIEKIRAESTHKLIDMASKMAAEGASKRDIDELVKNYVELKVIEFYKKSRDFQHISSILKNNMRKDSRAEISVVEILTRNEIEFRFQYEIPPYRVDFLIGEDLVLEVDGPHHADTVEYDAIRDEYLENFGYRVLRVPIRLFAISEEAVVKHIKNELRSTRI